MVHWEWWPWRWPDPGKKSINGIKTQNIRSESQRCCFLSARRWLITKVLNFRVKFNVWSLEHTSAKRDSDIFVLYTNHTAENQENYARVWKKTYSGFYGLFSIYTILCGDLNLDTRKDSKINMIVKNTFTILLQKRNFEPTRVTPTSATCIDHILTRNEVSTETIKTTISDHYTVLATNPGLS